MTARTPSSGNHGRLDLGDPTVGMRLVDLGQTKPRRKPTEEAREEAAATAPTE